MSSHTITHSLNLSTITCYKCAVVFAIPTEHKERLLRDGGDFYCPNGHVQHYSETEVMRLQRELTSAKSQALRLSHEVDTVRTEHAKTSDELKRLETRVKNGVCPCCKRSFQNLKRHIKTKHPKYKPTT